MGFHQQSEVLRVTQLVDGDDGPPVGRICWMWCPGCDTAHAPRIVGEAGDLPTGPCWEWDGDVNQPTFSPSLLVYAGASDPRCHSFIRAGQWEFLSDSAHPLAGQTVPMVPLPEWLRREDD